jgi:hypothetical protein
MTGLAGIAGWQWLFIPMLELSEMADVFFTIM